MESSRSRSDKAKKHKSENLEQADKVNKSAESRSKSDKANKPKKHKYEKLDKAAKLSKVEASLSRIAQNYTHYSSRFYIYYHFYIYYNGLRNCLNGIYKKQDVNEKSFIEIKNAIIAQILFYRLSLESLENPQNKFSFTMFSRIAATYYTEGNNATLKAQTKIEFTEDAALLKDFWAKQPLSLSSPIIKSVNEVNEIIHQGKKDRESPVVTWQKIQGKANTIFAKISKEKKYTKKKYEFAVGFFKAPFDDNIEEYASNLYKTIKKMQSPEHQKNLAKAIL